MTMFKKLITVTITAIMGITFMSYPVYAAVSYTHAWFGSNAEGATEEVQGVHRYGTVTMATKGGVTGTVIENCNGTVNPYYHTAIANEYTKDKIWMKGGCTYKVAFKVPYQAAVDVYVSNDYTGN